MLSLVSLAPTSFAAPTLSARAPTLPAASVFMQEAAAVVEPEPEPPFNSVTFAKSLPGVSAPLGFFDPLGFCTDVTEGKVRFLREVELKHSRVAMLAAVGFLVGEQFHPLFGGSVDVPSYIAFQQTPLQTFWPAVVLAIAVVEVFSVFTFQAPTEQAWAIRTDHAAGDLGFDPLGLKPANPAELAEMQTKELNNGRAAMFAIAGMVGQELANGAKLF
jgi:light-harvesting complex I chlorophyll a/b binding protein 4